MCNVSEFVNQLENNLLELQAEEKKLKKVLSSYDSKINKIYHDLEVKIFNKHQGNAIARELQSLLRKRRAIKSELEKYNSVKQTLGGLDQSKIKRANQNLKRLRNKNEKYMSGWKIDLPKDEKELINL